MFSVSFTLVGVVVLIFVYKTSSYEHQCSCYLAESMDGSGLGLFLNRDVEPFEILEKSIGVPIPFHCVLWNPLIYYVEGLNGTHALLALGSGMLLNHAPGPLANIRKVMLYEDGAWVFREPFLRSIDFLHEYTAFSKKGEEVLVDYGEGWFEERGLTVSDLFSIRNNGDKNTTIMLSSQHDIESSCTEYWISVKPERKEVVALKAISSGTVVELSRALLIPVTEYLISSGPLEEVLWWLNENHRPLQSPTEHLPTPYTVPDHGSTHGEYALLLSGKSALISSTSMDCESNSSTLPNVELRYVSKGGDQQCDNIMIVETVAMRDIAPNEKLYVDSCLRLPNQRKILQGGSRESLKQCLSIDNTVTKQVEL